MESHEVEITISRSGQVQALVKGAKGKACLQYAELLARIVGEISDQRFTSEYYEPDSEVHIDLEQKQGS